MKLVALADVRNLIGHCRPNTASDPADVSVALWFPPYLDGGRMTEKRRRMTSDHRTQASPRRDAERSGSYGRVVR
jgi:hypothetical protein